jgi:GPH family glycoside/pentoside/hexuronide:cation symporter
MSLEGKLGPGTRASWTFTALPENIKNGAWDAFVLFYYAQVLGLDGSLIALALGLILITDALVDPYVGTLSDSLRNAPLGRRHTLMLLATVPFGIGFSGVFSPPDGLTQWGLFAWLLGFGVVARVGISFFTVPAFAVGVELTRDPKERSLVMALRNIGASAGMLLVPLIAFRLFFTPTEEFPRGQLNPEPYSGFGLALTAIALGAMLVAAFGTRSRIREVEALEAGRVPDAEQPGSSLRNLARELVTAMRVTPNVRRVLAVSFLVFIINSTITTLTLYLATYFWRFGPAQTEQLLVAGTVGSFCGLVTAWWLVARVEKKTMMVASILTYFGCGLLSIGLPLLGLAPAAATVALGMLVVSLRLVGGLCYGWYLVAAGTVTFDVSDEHEVNTRRPQQGLVMSFVFLGLQAASAVAGVLAGTFLDVIEFPRGIPVEQMPVDKVNALATFVCAIIVTGAALLVVVIRGFDVSAAKQRAINEQLAALRAGR